MRLETRGFHSAVAGMAARPAFPQRRARGREARGKEGKVWGRRRLTSGPLLSASHAREEVSRPAGLLGAWAGTGLRCCCVDS
jgi:hypothetical protein